MKKGGGVSDRYEDKERKIGGVVNKKKMEKNMQRLGGRGGLSLESFANAKARNDKYNPSVITDDDLADLTFENINLHEEANS